MTHAAIDNLLWKIVQLADDLDQSPTPRPHGRVAPVEHRSLLQTLRNRARYTISIASP